ncbi:MAG TPA: nucleoside hydrolase [Segeticoccus sp.]|uniref:nucleoside hydrolase n=1 Tax=Segeticoccus sp. TaxID=2706531 RepID=UPI002D80C191|nr:nucleoside hydrolase [Segeticoccus sp.]HET8599428.1 nucleoside hydrolase [Segeticoccus sp.]
MSHPSPVVLDVDTGVDDALAILLAARHPALDLRAVTCVGGNAPVDRVVRNTLVVLEAAGRPDVPVARGAARPLLEPSRDARHVHGEDGMGDLGWPDAAAELDPRHAVELLRDLLLPLAGAPEEERITLVTLAPLTNIALLLRTWPEAAAGLRRIVMMGGTAGTGNATASAEFNVWHDPEAAAVVLDVADELSRGSCDVAAGPSRGSCDVAAGRPPITLYGLDVFYDVVVERGRAAELVAEGRRTGNRAAELGGLLVEFQCERFESAHATIGDAGAVCAVVDPDGLRTSRLPVRVELAGSYSRGHTIVDRRDWSGDLAHDPHGIAPTQVDVALAVDAKRYADLWLGALGTLEEPARRPTPESTAAPRQD